MEAENSRASEIMKNYQELSKGRKVVRKLDNLSLYKNDPTSTPQIGQSLKTSKFHLN